MGAAGVEDVGVGGSSPFEVAGVAPVAPFLFAGLVSLVGFFLGLALLPCCGVGGAWLDTAGEASGRGCSLVGAGGGGICCRC